MLYSSFFGRVINPLVTVFLGQYGKIVTRSLRTDLASLGQYSNFGSLFFRIALGKQLLKDQC